MRKTLFISDMDGTLLGRDSRLSPESRVLLNEAIARGALFSVATARTPATISRLMEGVSMNLPAVVMTGAALWHPGPKGSTGSYQHVVQMDSARVEFLINLYREHHLPAFIYTLRRDGVIHIRHIGPMSAVETEFMNERAHSPFKIFEIPESGESDFSDGYPEAALLFSMQPTNIVLPVYETLKDNPLFRPNFYHDMYGEKIALMEVFNPLASKAAAIDVLRRETGADCVVAFGDNINDLPMLRAADLAVAVENAIPEVKEAADIVIGPNCEDSVPKFILDRL